jgi:hypothetical protein
MVDSGCPTETYGWRVVKIPNTIIENAQLLPPRKLNAGPASTEHVRKWIG